jgi:hypothetical protein
VPGEDCFIDQRILFEVYGRNEGFMKEWFLYISLIMRAFGANSETRKDKLRQKGDEYYNDIKHLFKLPGD